MAQWLSRVFPQVSPHTVGLSLRYGIYIRAAYWGDRHLIAHECVHTGQYERFGSSAKFLTAYFSQCLVAGYPGAALEQEAVMRSAELLDSVGCRSEAAVTLPAEATEPASTRGG